MNFVYIPVAILFIIAFLFNNQYKEFFELNVLSYFIGEKPDKPYENDYIAGKNNFSYKNDLLNYEILNLKYELGKTRLFYTIIFLFVGFCLIALYYNGKNLFENTTKALYNSGIIDMINGSNETFLFEDRFYK